MPGREGVAAVRITIGDRVKTPEGPATVVGTVEREDRHYRPPQVFVYILVETDTGRVRQWRADVLKPLTSSRGEHEAESLASERRMEEKHGEP